MAQIPSATANAPILPCPGYSQSEIKDPSTGKKVLNALERYRTGVLDLHEDPMKRESLARSRSTLEKTRRLEDFRGKTALLPFEVSFQYQIEQQGVVFLNLEYH